MTDSLRNQLQAALGTAYKIEREFGGGGMSRVFLARETALGRHVVVKVLSGEIVAGLSADRFAREVRLAASLQHPNIVPVLATGVADGIPYYTMPYVKGESLRARMKETPALPRRHAVSILRDLARALHYAHGEGVIHRDIKPENVLLSSDAAVVTDFGIAKAISAARTSAAEQSDAQSGMTLTQAGSAIGTPAYMAPEQVAGDRIDHRADLYAWGLVAYELLSGAHPFAGKTTPTQLMGAQLSQSPVSLHEKAPGISPLLAALVMRCLEKGADDRPASAAELLKDLDAIPEPGNPESRRLPRHTRNIAIASTLIVATIAAAAAYKYRNESPKTAVPVARSSVAVLPFADDRADSANAYFGEGIADELMTALAKVPGLRVASRTSSIALGRRQDLDVREIGRQLGVSSVVEGTVRRSGTVLRVTAQLTNVADGLTLWSDSYQRGNRDVFAVQDDITQAIVAALRPELAGGVQDTNRGPGTSDPEAYDLYLRGLYLLERRGTGVERAAEYFTEAIRKDSAFARAHAALASALAFFPYFAGVPAERVEHRIRVAAVRSLELDPSLGAPRAAMALAHWHALRWKEADAEFRRAIAADSASPVAHVQYGRVLLSRGQIADALKQFRIARALDPLGGTASVWLATGLGYSGDHASAWEESKRARELDPNLATAHTFLAFERVNAERLDQARVIVGEETWPIPFNGQAAYALQVTGETARAAAIRKTLDATPDTVWMIHTARAFGLLGIPDTSRALTEMEEAVARRELLVQAIPFMDRMFDPVRKSPRFAALVRRTGLDGLGFTGH